MSIDLPDKFKDVTLLAKGKRGIVYTAKLDGELVAVKIAREDSDAFDANFLEGFYLDKVNELGIGPKLMDVGEDYVAMEFIDGVRIDQFLGEASSDEIIEVIDEVFRQTNILDKNNINKFEMTNPYKHIIVKNDNKPVLIDFERARHTARPKNTAQFAEYVTRRKDALESKGLSFDKDNRKLIKK